MTQKKQATTFIALLRAINVGGKGILSMKELATMCVELGFENVRTYIQSGNVIFNSALPEATVRTRLEQALAERLGKKIDVIVRTAAELRAILDANPFPAAPPAKVAVVFLSDPMPKNLLRDVIAPDGEQVRLGDRELYIYYPNGMGRSKLKIPSLNVPATVRNINTVTKLVAIARSPT
jgi:uncharacterized protein (DUF1697 family)